MRSDARVHGKPGGRRARRFKRAAGIALLLATAVLPALAEHTRWWRQSTYEEFDRGKAHGVALRSDGKAFLAPRFTQTADANLAYLWQLRADSKGNLYAAGGSNAKVLRLDAKDKPATAFESSELSAQAIAFDTSDNLYVGTSPDGKVYKVTSSGEKSVFFDPKTKYIWDLAVDRDGTVYVATGDTGKIFAVTPDGKSQVFYDSDEAHIRAITLDAHGNLLAGTEPDGLILRIPKAAEPPGARPQNANAASAGGKQNVRRAFVVYETSKQEVTSILLDAKGNLYAAAIGEKTRATPAGLRPPAEPQVNIPVTVGNAQAPQNPQAQQLLQMQQALAPFVPFPTLNSSSVYRIAPDGSPEELWSSRSDLVYSLGFGADGKLLLGTGNQGAVIQLEEDRVFSRIVKADSDQVTSFAAGPAGKLFVATANPGKIFTLGPENEAEGTFESQPFDARIFSNWGRLTWWGNTADAAKTASAARVEFYARTGNTSNPDNNWSPWTGPYSNARGDKIDCPPARFVQWKAVLRGGSSGPVPQLDWVSVAYLPKNVAPVITGIAVQSPGIRVQGISIGPQGPQPLTPVQLQMPQPAARPFGNAFAASFGASANDGENAAAVQPPVAPHFEAPPQGFQAKGYQAVLWSAEDANDDQLEYSVYYRGENEKEWKLLKGKLETKFYSWDTTTMPDGAYYLKIVASDAPSNPEGDALTAERVSDRFEVNNTPPAISNLTAEAAGSSARVRFEAADPSSTIARAQYSLDAGDWTTVFPDGGLSDAPRERYDFALTKLAPGEHTVSVRVYDQFENVATSKTTFHTPSRGN